MLCVEVCSELPMTILRSSNVVLFELLLFEAEDGIGLPMADWKMFCGSGLPAKPTFVNLLWKEDMICIGYSSSTIRCHVSAFQTYPLPLSITTTWLLFMFLIFQ